MEIEATISEEEFERVSAAVEGVVGTRDGLFFALGATALAAYLADEPGERIDAGKYLAACLEGGSDVLALMEADRSARRAGGVRAVVIGV